MKRVTEAHANVRVPARVYDVEGGAIFAKNSTFVFFDGFAWTPRLRPPSPIMAPVKTLLHCFSHIVSVDSKRSSEMAGSVAVLTLVLTVIIATETKAETLYWG